MNPIALVGILVLGCLVIIGIAIVKFLGF